MPRSEGSISQFDEPRSALSPAPPAGRFVAPEALACWLEDHGDAIAERWFLDMRGTGLRDERPYDGLVRSFLHLLVDFLPPGMTGYRDQVEPLFQQAAELYGNLGALRGLAAGEAVEEFQVLREVLFRFLHAHPPGNGEESLGLRELLQLNRFVDTGVTYASVGHTDTLFFNLFQGGGVGVAPEESVGEEIVTQISALRDELQDTLTVRAPEPAARPT